MTIDIGSAATNRASGLTDLATYIELGNPANATGTITSVFIWCATALENTKVGTFFGAAGTFENRDFETIGQVVSGAERTFAGLDIDVTVGDFIGLWYDSGGRVDADASGGSGIYSKAGDQFGQGEQAGYAFVSGGDAIMSINGTGTESAVGNAGIMTPNTGFWGQTF